MSVQLLGALIVAGLAGPLLRLPKKWGVPLAVGELLIGTVFGASGFQKIPYQDPTLKLLATVGFALLMFTAGSHIDYRTITKKAFHTSFWILLLNLGVAIALGLVIDHVAHFSNWKLVSAISFSSSAAFVIPIVQNYLPSITLSVLIAQVTIADALAFISLPFFTQKHDQLKATEGALIVMVISIFIYFALRYAKSRGWLDRAHELSKADHLGLELRVSLGLLLLVAALATHFHASVMIAGFSLGVALASNGVPHRLARQLFGISEGFFAPLYFVWLGASIDIRDTFHSRDAVMLAILLCIGAFIAHLPARAFGQPIKYIFLASAQLGIPAAAVTLGAANGVLTGAESGAIMLSALVTLILPSVFLTFLRP